MAKELKVLNDIIKKHGKGSAFIGKGNIANIERWDIDSPKISELLGGGLPKGRMLEVYGPESSSKTSLACYLAAQIQKQGGVVGFIDVEHALDPEYAETFGLIVEDMIICQPSSAEEAMDIVEQMVASKEIDLVILDSVAALAPQAELNGEMGDAHMALVARLMSQACRKLTAMISQNNCSVLFINQIRMKIGGYGNPEETTGGKALKFYSSIRIEVRKVEMVAIGEQVIGMVPRLKTVKNKTAPPFRKCELKIIFHDGYQTEEEYIDFAVQFGIIDKAGSWYAYNNEKLGQGKANAVKSLKASPEVLDGIKKKVIDSLYPKKEAIEAIRNKGSKKVCKEEEIVL